MQLLLMHLLHSPLTRCMLCNQKESTVHAVHMPKASYSQHAIIKARITAAHHAAWMVLGVALKVQLMV